MLVTNTDTPGQPQGSNPYSPQPRQPWYKRWWAIMLFVLAAGAAIFGIVMLASGSDDPEDMATSAEIVETLQPTRGGDDPIDDSSARGDEPTEITDEYEETMKDAESYLELFAFSKSELYDQLTSEYGEGLSHEAAQYAVDNVDVDWNEQALKWSRFSSV
ncbi:Ltp family lipoprotein [Trueperella bonasi]|nr:Ltp family lipoprotein [Trueperella bonasi]